MKALRTEGDPTCARGQFLGGRVGRRPEKHAFFDSHFDSRGGERSVSGHALTDGYCP